jgi:hypothetical protein
MARKISYNDDSKFILFSDFIVETIVLLQTEGGTLN